MIVTVEPQRGKTAPALAREDVTVLQERERLPVTSLVACQGANSALELFVLIDDASDTSLGSQLQELRSFIDSRPPDTAIGIGYMHNGTVEIVQSLTKDHARAAAALRLPMGGATGTNPYLSVSGLIHQWAQTPARREILMLTPGVGAFDLGSEYVRNIFVDAAIADAQRAGIIVYAIYALGIGHTGHSLWFNIWAQNYLAQLTEETGGEAYSLNFGSPVSIAPYLSDLETHLNHQYWLTFTAKPDGKKGLQHVKVTTEVPGAELLSPDKVYLTLEPL